MGPKLVVIASSLLGCSAAFKCVSDEDCNLNGICVNEVCACVPEWTGQTCGKLNLHPARPSPHAGYDELATSSWGASILADNDGLYHMFVSRMTNHCGLGSWTSNSEIIRATSKDPEGPYVYEETVMEHFAHNPVVRRLPNGTYMMLHIGCGLPFKPERSGCVNGTSKHPEECSNVTAGLLRETLEKEIVQDFDDEPICNQFNVSVKTAPQLTGPWSASRQVFLSSGDAESWFVNADGRQFSNPSPHIDGDGKIRCAFRADAKDSNESFPEYISIATTESIYGPYVDMRAKPAVATHRGEDPFLWKDERGHWHLLMHNMGDEGLPGSHAFSRDAVTWTRSDVPPYDYNVDFTDGTAKVMKRRERPQLVLNEKGQPRLFTSGVEVCSDHTYTLVMRFRTGEDVVV